jgi:hypothetical protein
MADRAKATEICPELTLLWAKGNAALSITASAGARVSRS